MTPNGLSVSTKIRDRTDAVIAELIENEWKVASPPRTWDRNYNNDSLEVIDADGYVVLQIRVSTNIVRIQGAWWITFGNQRLQMILKGSSTSGGHIILVPVGLPRPQIEQLFGYPSDLHPHELRNQH
jgi:hypothetical protein